MSEGKPQVDIFRYLGIIKRRKWFFVIPAGIICFSFFVASLILPKIYQAQALILVEDKKVVNPLLQNLAVSTTVQSRLNSLREEILAWPRLFQLVERLDLAKEASSPLELERLIANIRQNITLTLKSNEIVLIAYNGRDPKSTQKLVNTLCDILIQRNLSLQSEDTASAIDFINEQLGIYKDKLNTSEGQLRQFKEVYGLGTLPGLEDASPAGVTLAQINRELAALEAEKVMALVDCTPEHPRIKELTMRIDSLKEKRNQYIKSVAQDAGVKTDAYIKIADSLPRQQEELAILSRDKAINERIYGMLLERLESAKITESLDTSENRTKFRIIEPARLPLIPIKPNRIKFNILGLVLGGMIGFGFVYLLEYTDSSFKSEDDLKRTFGYPVLGSISRVAVEKEMYDKKRKTRKILIIASLSVIILGIILRMILG